MFGLRKIVKLVKGTLVLLLLTGIPIYSANFPNAETLNQWVQEKKINELQNYLQGKIYIFHPPSTMAVRFLDMKAKLIYTWEVKLDWQNGSLQYQSKGTSQNFELKIENNKLCVMWNGDECIEFLRFYETRDNLSEQKKFGLNFPFLCIFSRRSLKKGETYPETCREYISYELYIEQYDKQKQVEFFKTGQYPFPGIEPKNPPATKSNKKRMGN